MHQASLSRDAAGGGESRGSAHRRTPRLASAVRWASIAAIVVSLVLLVRMLPATAALRAISGWVEGAGFLGVLAFAGVYLVATVLALPGLILTVTAGVVFGLLWGTVAVSIGSTLGVAATFLIGRYLARDAVAKRIQRYPRFAAVDRAVGEGGWKVVVLLRLSPVVPFNLQNYLYGLTALRFWPCVLASWAAMLPGTFLYVYLGYAGRTGIEAATGAETERTAGEWALLAVGLVATLVVTVYVTRLARRAMKEGQSGAAQGLSAEEPAAARSKADEEPQARRVGFVLPLAAVLLVGLTACAHLNRQWLAGLFGPPAVTLQEVYEEKPDGPTFDHSAFDSILRRHVDASGGVDYAALIAEPEPLLAYNRSLAEAPFDEMGRNEKLALLINAYNSFTLELMVEWLPRAEIESIRDIPAAKRWDDERWRVGRHTFSLNGIEHEQIRPKFVEPNIHWAVVCAAVGCPPLRREAYMAERVGEQLADQAARLHTDGSRWLRYERDKGLIHLTPLYDWYGGDFEQVAGSVLEYAARSFAPLREDLDAGRTPRIAWLEYDWAPNDQERVP